MTHITCRLTAKNRYQLRNPTFSNRVWLPFLLCGPRNNQGRRWTHCRLWLVWWHVWQQSRDIVSLYTSLSRLHIASLQQRQGSITRMYCSVPGQQIGCEERLWNDVCRFGDVRRRYVHRWRGLHFRYSAEIRMSIISNKSLHFYYSP